MTFSKCKIIYIEKPVYLYFRCLSNLSDVGEETGAVLMQHWKQKKSEQTACKHFNILQRCGLKGLCQLVLIVDLIQPRITTEEGLWVRL